jgi:NAD(P)-dependent dehydrogenase (short-subunit alcohol dehydrogenase family)
LGTVSFDFSGETALVTGAARGLGRDLALAFGRAGAHVVCVDAPGDVAGLDYAVGSPEALRETAAAVEAAGAKALAVEADVRSEPDVERMVTEALDRFGSVEILVNNAGVYTGGVPATETSEEQWAAAVDVNLKGPFLCTKHVARHMTARGGGGRVITISSTSALVGIPNQVAYQSSKHGVVGQVRTLALELAPHGITVNTVCPTVVTTPMLDHLMQLGAAYFQDVARLCGASTVFPGLDALDPQDVTNAVLWLASDAARYVTGIALPVDGGFTCK